MSNGIEKQFFDTFGIEQIEYTQCTSIGCKHIYSDCNICSFHNVYKKDYPQITDRILLELICIVLNTFQTFEVYRNMDIDSLKEKILKLSMLAKDNISSQVRTLFEEADL